MNEELPPNSHKSKGRSNTKEEKVIKQVTSGEAIRRKKPLGKQFKETFIGGNAKAAGRHMFFEVLIPSAKEAIVEAFEDGIRGLILGDTRRRSSAPRPGGPGATHFNYSRFANTASQAAQASRTMSKQARAKFDFDEIVLTDRGEAQEVIDQLFEILSKYEMVNVADLYSLVGIPSTHTDHNWGWVDLHGAGIARIRGGYLLDLPEPEPLN